MKTLVVVALALLVVAWPATAATLDEVLDTVGAVQMRQLRELTVSPDGKYALAVLNTDDTHYMQYMVGIRARVLALVDTARGEATLLTAPHEDAHAAAWSWDGKRVAFYSRAEGKARVEVLDVATRARRVVAVLSGEARNPAGVSPRIAWSSDSSLFAYTVSPQPNWVEERAGLYALAPAARTEPVVIEENQRIPPLLQIAGQRRQFFGPEPPKEIWVAPADGAAPRKAGTTTGELLAIEGDEIVTREGDQLVVRTGEGEPLRIELLAETAFVSRTTERELVAVASDASALRTLVIARRGGRWTRGAMLQAALPPTFTPAAAMAGGKRVAGFVDRGVFTPLTFVDLPSGRTTTHLTDANVRRQMAVTPRGATYAVVGTPTKPETLYRIDGAAPLAVTRWPGTPAEITYGRVSIVNWKSDDATIEGVLVLPNGGAPPYPTVVYLHGGPDVHITADLRWLASAFPESAAHVLASRGYAVLVPNVRGSTGYGVEHVRALRGGHLYDLPARDVYRAVEMLAERGIADPKRLGIYGFSYGAMLTAWIIGRDHRFRAAIAGAGGYDMLHDDRSRTDGRRAFHAYGEERSGDGDDLLDHWKNPEKYRELSPIERAYHVRTPTLFVSTVAEGSEPTDHAGFFNALLLNGVPAKWVYYPMAWHGGGWSDALRRDLLRHIVGWFDTHLAAR